MASVQISHFSFTERFGFCVLFSHLCIYTSLWFMGYIPPFQMWACFKHINRFGLNLFLQFLHVSFWTCIFFCCFFPHYSKIYNWKLDAWLLQGTSGWFWMLQLKLTLETLLSKEMQESSSKINGITVIQINVFLNWKDLAN